MEFMVAVFGAYENMIGMINVTVNMKLAMVYTTVYEQVLSLSTTLM